MKIVYIAHPVSGDIRKNLIKIKQIVRDINIHMPDVLPFVHYWLDCHALNDNIPEERERGIKNDIALLKAGFIDEMWLFGNHVSKGMQHEIELANKLKIPVISKSESINL
jgi:hypothetical protein